MCKTTNGILTCSSWVFPSTNEGSLPALLQGQRLFFLLLWGKRDCETTWGPCGSQRKFGVQLSSANGLAAVRSTLWTKPSNHFFPDRLVTAAAHSEIVQPDENWRGKDKSLTPFWPFLALYLLKILSTWLSMVNKETDQPLHFKPARSAKQALHHQNRKFFWWPANAMTQ